MKTFKINQGLDLQLAGAPDQKKAPERKDVRRAYATGVDYVGMKPTICVEIGEKVLAGQLLFEDKKNPGVKFTSPGAGTIAAINRGEKRAFRSIEIDLEQGKDSERSVQFEKFDVGDLLKLDASKVRAQLVKSGLWTAFRTRPFSRVPKIDTEPVALFVNACDTNPHAPNPKPLIEANAADFVNGVRVLSRISGRSLHVCVGAGEWRSEIIDPCEAIPFVDVAQFLGKHPAGLVGTHIAKLAVCGLNRVAWSIGWQDVIAIGKLFTTGEYPTRRVVSLSGPRVKRPRLLDVNLGASLTELVDGELENTDVPQRVISGSVLCGRAAEEGLDGLGRYVNQITVIDDGDPRELFGWLLPATKKFSAAGTVLSKYLPNATFAMTTAMHGGARAVFPNPIFDKVLPLDIEPVFLFKALEIGDIDQCEKLGAFELDEEDLALCTLVDFGKNDYGKSLRALLDKAMKEEE